MKEIKVLKKFPKLGSFQTFFTKLIKGPTWSTNHDGGPHYHVIYTPGFQLSGMKEFLCKFQLSSKMLPVFVDQVIIFRKKLKIFRGSNFKLMKSHFLHVMIRNCLSISCVVVSIWFFFHLTKHHSHVAVSPGADWNAQCKVLQITF